MLPSGALIWLAPIWLIWAQIAQPTSNHLKSDRNQSNWNQNFLKSSRAPWSCFCCGHGFLLIVGVDGLSPGMKLGTKWVARQNGRSGTLNSDWHLFCLCEQCNVLRPSEGEAEAPQWHTEKKTKVHWSWLLNASFVEHSMCGLNSECRAQVVPGVRGLWTLVIL